MLLVVRSSLPGGARWWLWTCTVGLVMGLFAFWYVPFLKGKRAGAAARHAVGIARGGDPPYPPGTDPMKGQDIGGIARGGDPPYPPGTDPMKGQDIGPVGPEPDTDYSSRESGSNTVSSTETPGSSTRS